MEYSHVMIRYGELGTKGKNKSDFLQTLFKNVKIAFKEENKVEVSKSHDRVYLSFENVDSSFIEKRLHSVSGIQNFSFANKVDASIDAINEEALKQALDETEGTFKVIVKRADKRFPVHSDEVVRLIATHILKNTNHKVDIHQPTFYIRVEIRNEGTYVFKEVIQGQGGYPLGTLGKALVLTSGGIDSPVAVYQMLKRGIKVEAIHFASPPYTSPEAVNKVKDLLAKFNDIQEVIKLYIVPFTKLQEAIYRNVDESYAITIMRRMMYRISEQVALHYGCQVLASGESIGQVASQTLESMATINEVIKMPMIRPLATVDKLDIIETAKRIDTYEISILPHIDCCTIFTPIHPVTKPTSKKAEQYEATFDYQPLLEECVGNVEVIYIKKEEINETISSFL